MRLLIKNFCCWENSEFIFPDKGNVLISAESGEGKTSIIRAIIFALFGYGQKIIQHGKKSCSVELFFHDLHIIRSKGPGRLIVNGVHEDDDGQNIINKIFTNEMFYLEQGNVNSFVLMSPNDKLEYLEQIIFNKINISEIKTKSKNVIKDRENKLLILKTECQTIEKLLEELVIDDTMDFIPDYNESILEKKTLEYTETFNTYRKLKQDNKDKTEFNARLNEIIIRIDGGNNSIQENLSEIDAYKHKYEDLGDVKMSLDTNMSELNYVTSMSKYEKIKQEYMKQREIYETIIKNEKNDIDTKIESIESKVNVHFPSIYEAKSVIDNLRQILNLKKPDILIHTEQEYLEMVSEREKNINTLREIKSLYTCPQCFTSLKIHNNVLTENPMEADKDTIEQSINTLTASILCYENGKRRIDDYNKRFKYLSDKVKNRDINLISDYEKEYEDMLASQGILTDYYEQLEVVVQKYDRIRSHLGNLNQQCGKLKKEISLYTKTDRSENEIKSCIEELQKNTGLQDHYKGLISSLEHKNKEQCKILNQLSKEKHTIEDSLNNIRDVTGNIDEFEDKLETLRDEIDVLKKYDIFHKSVVLRNRYKSQASDLNDAIYACEKSLTAAIGFKEKILEAESIALTNLVNTININIQTYLAGFFDKEPLNATLSCFKTVKKATKPQINISIEHKGNQIDLQNLSGGERDRVILAYVLTLSELSHSPIVILDECISSLDSFNSDNVFRCIKENCKNSLVILIAHQIVTGIFDDIITL